MLLDHTTGGARAGITRGLGYVVVGALLIYETQTLGATPATPCNALWPSRSFPRKEAGGPLHANTLKCRLKPLEAGD